jgi:hypothetical protein
VCDALAGVAPWPEFDVAVLGELGDRLAGRRVGHGRGGGEVADRPRAGVGQDAQDRCVAGAEPRQSEVPVDLGDGAVHRVQDVPFVALDWTNSGQDDDILAIAGNISARTA